MIIRHDMMPLYWAVERGAIRRHQDAISQWRQAFVNGRGRETSAARMAAESMFLNRQTDLVDNIISLLVGAGGRDFEEF